MIDEETKEVKENKTKLEKKTKKSKKDVVEDLDEILYGNKSEEQVDLGDIPEFLSLGKGKKDKKEETPDYLKY